MKEGSLVTPRWKTKEMLVEIEKIAPFFSLFVIALPTYGGIYTVKHLSPPCKCCGRVDTLLEEIPQIFRGTFSHKGLPIDFYVEVDPPCDIQTEVQKILEETPIVVEAYIL